MLISPSPGARFYRFEATEESLRTLIEEHWQTSLSSSRHSSKPKKSAFRPEPTEEAEEAKKPAAGENDDDEGDQKEKVEVVGKDGVVTQVEISGAGLRKIRMGQFQDTGRCKGYVYVPGRLLLSTAAQIADGRSKRVVRGKADARPRNADLPVRVSLLLDSHSLTSGTRLKLRPL